MKNKYKIALLTMSICLSIAFLFGTSYALWTDTKTQEDENIIVAGCFFIEFEDSNLISLDNTYPMTDEKGLATTPYTMTVKNTCNIAAKMQIVMNVMNTTTMSAEKVALQVSGAKTINKTIVNTLTEVEPVGTKAAQATTAYEITTDTLKPEETKTYEFRMWIDETAGNEVENQIFQTNIVIHSTATKINPPYADASGAEAPELDNGLIPVVYQDNKWKKADTTQQWYDYDNQWWANAVTVKEANRIIYTSAEAGTEIPMSAINTMWVWIPRYEYQTDNLTYIEDNTIHNQYAGGSISEPGAININFVSKETTTASASNFLIHPAFTFGTQQLSGMWVAKFEMSSGDTTCTPVAHSVGTGCDLPTIKPTILPNVTSWSGARVGTFFTAIQENMNGSNGLTTYGLFNNDTHMMKNMEWGAIAYLSQSKYGKYGNATYTGANKEVAINNCNKSITGIGGDTVSATQSSTTCTTNTYETAKGQAASTTGNIYGVYDMSGGAYEFVMGVMKESTNTEIAIGYSLSLNSGFGGKLYDGTDYTGTYGALRDIDAKYYDVYNYGTTYSDTAAYERGHQGDAITETVEWYIDSKYMVGGSTPWILRGDVYNANPGVRAGVFAFGGTNGPAYADLSARPVLVSAAS